MNPPLIERPEKKLLILRHVLRNLGKNNKVEKKMAVIKENVFHAMEDKIAEFPFVEAVEARELRIKRNREFSEEDERQKKRKPEEKKEKETKEEEEHKEFLERIKSYGISDIFYCSEEESIEERLEERKWLAKQGDASPVEITENIWSYFTSNWRAIKLVLLEDASKPTIVESMKKGLTKIHPKSMARKCLGKAIQVMEEVKSIEEFPSLYFNTPF